MSYDKSKANQKESDIKKNDSDLATQYLNFSFYRVDPKWRWLK